MLWGTYALDISRPRARPYLPGSQIIFRWIASIGAKLIAFLEESGQIALFLARALGAAVRPPFRLAAYRDQFCFIANNSVFIVSATALFSGMVFAVQFYFGFRLLNADALVGPGTALSFARELGPVFTAIVVTGRAGAAMAAELGTMRVTEQIDAMEVMGVSSVQYLVSPRIVTGFLALPILNVVFIFVGNLGSYLTGVYILGIEPWIFFAHLDEFVQVRDVTQGLIKSAVFGLMFATFGTYYGYFTQGGAEAVGRATTRAVVTTLVLILISDYFLTLVIRYFFYGG